MIMLGVLGVPTFIILIIGFVALFVIAVHYIGKEKRVSQTPEEVGKLLFACACKSVFEDLEKPEHHNLKSIRDNTNPNIFDVELLIATLDATVNSVWAIIGSSNDKTYQIIDCIYATFADYLQTVVADSGDKNIDGKRYLMSRHKEYDEARQEKRGPNELWPLAKCILKNLLGKDTDAEQKVQDIAAISIYYSGQITFFGHLLKNIYVKD